MKKSAAYFLKLVTWMFMIQYLFSIIPGIAQNVGIGTTTPTRAKLEVYGAAGTGRTSALFGGDSTGVSVQRNFPGIGFNQYQADEAWGRYIATGHAAVLFLNPNTGWVGLDIYSSGTRGTLASNVKRTLTIDGQGNTGIAGAGVNSELQLPNTINNRKITLWEAANNAYQYFGLGIQSGTITYNVAGLGDRHAFLAGTSSSSSRELMSIWGSGNVIMGSLTNKARLGINSDNPTNTLEIVQDATSNTTSGPISDMAIAIFRPAYAGQPETSWGMKIYNVPGGNYFGFYKDRYIQSAITPSGDYYNYSDKRFKKNIESVGSVLGNVLKLNAVTYNSIYDTASLNKSMGFLAQEVQQLFPELVGQLSQGNDPKLGLNYAGFGVLAIKAIQEQQQEIEALKERLEKLEHKQ